MRSSARGGSISDLEVTNISAHSIWLLTSEKELFVPYSDFPRFKEEPVGRILNVEEPTKGHYYWPDLDIDLSLECIEHPERFPLRASLNPADRPSATEPPDPKP